MDIINVIFDNRHADDYERLIKEFNEQDVEYKFWDAIVLSHSVVESINASHKMIVRWAKENELHEVIIAEQDLHFTSKDSWKYFMKNKPEEFDVYIGGSYLIDNTCEYKAQLVKVKSWVGNHLIIVNESYYDKFLSVPNNEHIDTYHRGGEFYVCFPMVAVQRSGWSANCSAMVNYNPIFSDHEDYLLK